MAGTGVGVNIMFESGSLDEEGAGTSMGRLVRDMRRDERNDLRNRFLSIHMDAKFLSDLVDAYRRHDCNYPVYANLRNGLWYRKEWDGACYFKSTDGHSGRWSFSYTRLNLHLAAAAASAGGCFVVDSTRNGKRFPDSFTSTVPIWCCVLNRLVASEICTGRGEERSEVWDTALHTPRWLSASETSQIEARLDGWLKGLGAAREPLRIRVRSFLKKPLRPVWISPETRIIDGMLPAWPSSPSSENDLSFTPIICVSSSKVISREHHREHHSWVYIQGAGDDEEHWSQGITPDLFWENAERLVDLAKNGHRGIFEDAVRRLLGASNRDNQAVRQAERSPGSSRTHVCSDGSGGAEALEEARHNSAACPIMRLLPDPMAVLCRSWWAGVCGGDGEGLCQSGSVGGGDWMPGGQEVHGSLGRTGLMVGSLSFAARHWPSLGVDCSLLNLSDQAVPESVVRRMVGPRRRYLHVFAKSGKKANPPRYWKSTIFPLALTFIAATVGGYSSSRGSESHFCDDCRDSEQHFTCVRGRRNATEEDAVDPAVDSAQHGCGMFKSVQTSPPAVLKKGIFTNHDDPDRGGWGIERDFAQDRQPADCLQQQQHHSSMDPLPPRHGDPLLKQCQPCSKYDHRHRQQGTLPGVTTEGRVQSSPGRCLVVCPTGAEASVVVCLAALLAFFPRDTPEEPACKSDSGVEGKTSLRERQETFGDGDSPVNTVITTGQTGGSTREKFTTLTREGGQGNADNAPVMVSTSGQDQTVRVDKKEACDDAESRTEQADGSTRRKNSVPVGGRGDGAAVTGHDQRRQECSRGERGARDKTQGHPGKEKDAVSVDEEGSGRGRRGGVFAVLPQSSKVTKTDVRWRFLLLQQECPWARPPRRLMQYLNEYFMTPGEQSWDTLRDMLLRCH